MWTVNFQMFKLDLEKAKELACKGTGLSKNCQGEGGGVTLTQVLPVKSSQEMGLSPVLTGLPSCQSLAYG